MKVSERETTMQAETSAVYRGRPLVVTVKAHFVNVREKGRRGAGVDVDWLSIYDLGMKRYAREKLAAEGRNHG